MTECHSRIDDKVFRIVGTPSRARCQRSNLPACFDRLRCTAPCARSGILGGTWDSSSGTSRSQSRAHTAPCRVASLITSSAARYLYLLGCRMPLSDICIPLLSELYWDFEAMFAMAPRSVVRGHARSLMEKSCRKCLLRVVGMFVRTRTRTEVMILVRDCATIWPKELFGRRSRDRTDGCNKNTRFG